MQLTSEGVTLIYGKDEQAIEAAHLLKDHLDLTAADQAAGRRRAAARDRFPGGEGQHPTGHGPPRRLRAHRRRLRRAGAVLARRTQLRSGAQRRDLALRHHSRPQRRRAAVSSRRFARRLSARRPGRSGRGAARGAQGARPCRHLRQAALRHVHRGSLRAFALQHCRLPPLPRSLPDRGNRAERRSCGDRSADLRRLRPMRRRLPDRRRGLCAAAVRRVAAQAAHAARRLPRSGRRAGGGDVP